MKKSIFLLALAALCTTAGATIKTPAKTQAKEAEGEKIFIYSPGEKDGLHIAALSGNSWTDLGQLCASDYGPWGSEKRMHNPFVSHATDGSWRLLFSVNNHAPCFAAAYSDDLITWRPQDYPRTAEKGILQPVMRQNADGSFDIYFRTADGSIHRMKADNTFRHFTEQAGSIPSTDSLWQRDTATVSGKLYDGNIFSVTPDFAEKIRQHFKAVAADNALSAERMKDDATRFASLGSNVSATLTVDPSNTKPISDKLVGVFFEDISYAADGGLYAEMVQNRDFEYTPADHKGWTARTAWTSNDSITIRTDNPLTAVNSHYAVLARRDTLYNKGWDGMTAQPNSQYDFSVFLRTANGKRNTVDVALIADDGTICAKGRIDARGNGWQRYSLPLTTGGLAQKKSVRLALTPQKGDIDVDMVSLFPHDTFKGHGLRKDLATAIADLHPKFMRFPGGCMSHGQGVDNIYHWQESIGPWQDRTPAKNIWHYHQTRGLGFYEYFQFCEDIGAEPLPVLAAGVPCQNSAANKDDYAGQQGGIPMEDMPAYCQEILNMIDWANGDPATSPWAKKRAEAGHPAPFNLHYIGIGNEDIISTAFEERFLMIAKAIKAKYPDITLCGTVGPFHDPSADYIEGWKFAKAHADIIDMADEHYYESPGWFMHHQDYYDHYDRHAPKVYLGEWASRGRTMENALVEAMHLCALERNADVIEMASYAPLLCNDRHANWNPDMIYFNHDSITALTPSYYTQKLWGNNSGTTYIASSLVPDEPTVSPSTGNRPTSASLSYRMAASVVKSTDGTTIIKLVNSLPASLTVTLSGISIPDGTIATGFTGKPGDRTIRPVTAPVASSHITLPPYSILTFRL